MHTILQLSGYSLGRCASILIPKSSRNRKSKKSPYAHCLFIRNIYPSCSAYLPILIWLSRLLPSACPQDIIEFCILVTWIFSYLLKYMTDQSSISCYCEKHIIQRYLIFESRVPLRKQRISLFCFQCIIINAQFVTIFPHANSLA